MSKGTTEVLDPREAELEGLIEEVESWPPAERDEDYVALKVKRDQLATDLKLSSNVWRHVETEEM
jgi:hypothetical protein